VNIREVEKTVLSHIVKGSSGGVVPDIDTMLGELEMDSLKLVETVFELETYYSITVDEDRMTELRTVSDIVEMIEAAIEKQST
jgi:acyl carrier protein